MARFRFRFRFVEQQNILLGCLLSTTLLLLPLPLLLYYRHHHPPHHHQHTASHFVFFTLKLPAVLCCCILVYTMPKMPRKVIHQGRWTAEEHQAFLHGLSKRPNITWKEISGMVKTRTARQSRTHAQKYFARIRRAQKLSKVSAEAIRSQDENHPSSEESVSSIKPQRVFPPPASTVLPVLPISTAEVDDEHKHKHGYEEEKDILQLVDFDKNYLPLASITDDEWYDLKDALSYFLFGA